MLLAKKSFSGPPRWHFFRGPPCPPNAQNVAQTTWKRQIRLAAVKPRQAGILGNARPPRPRKFSARFTAGPRLWGVWLVFCAARSILARCPGPPKLGFARTQNTDGLRSGIRPPARAIPRSKSGLRIYLALRAATYDSARTHSWPHAKNARGIFDVSAPGAIFLAILKRGCPTANAGKLASPSQFWQARPRVGRRTRLSLLPVLGICPRFGQ